MPSKMIVSSALFCCLLQISVAADGKSEEKMLDLKFSPVILDSKNSTGATVGLDYKLNGKLYDHRFDKVESGASFDSDAKVGSAQISYKGSGTIAASAERNPNDFLELQVDGRLLYSVAEIGTFSSGAFVKYEADQGFDNKNIAYGLSGTYGRYGVFASNDFFALDANYARVDPKDDVERKAALNGGALEAYYRWNFELLYKIPVDWSAVTDIEFNYRYFFENNAPSVIRSANLDKHDLATIRFGFKNDLFLAYSSGKLPFDKKNDQTVKIGFSYKIN